MTLCAAEPCLEEQLFIKCCLHKTRFNTAKYAYHATQKYMQMKSITDSIATLTLMCLLTFALMETSHHMLCVVASSQASTDLVYCFKTFFWVETLWAYLIKCICTIITISIGIMNV